MDNPLLATKLYIPRPPPKCVARPHLVERLDEGMTRPLTLLSAPAGFGKTTLLSEWLSVKKHPVAWIWLDERDNDPARFLAYLIAALKTIDDQIGESTLPIFQSPHPPSIEIIVTSLINEIASVESPTSQLHEDIALVLDDYHVIQAPSVHSAITFLLDHLPPSMHLYIATRTDPFPVARLRARGQLIEIREADLRFTLREIAAFLNEAMGLGVAPAEVASLEGRTEGWIAGLQLAAISMRGSDNFRDFIQAFSGSSRYILDYLMEEVLQRQPAEVQEFLLETSILDRFSAPLCDAVTGRGDSYALLQRLEEANIFIVPLDSHQQWYRYHHLFAELLRHRLRRTVGISERSLRRKASQWFEQNHQLGEAIRHALEALDWERAATLIVGESETKLARGEIVTLLNWLQALPDDRVRGNPELCLTYSWALILTGRLEAAEAYLAQAEAVAHAQHIAPLLGSINAAQTHIARTRGDDQRTIELSQRALASMPAEAFAERSAVSLNLGIALLNRAHIAEAEQALVEAERTAQQSANHYIRLIALTFLGIIQIGRGKLHGGEELFQHAIRSGGESPASAMAHLHYGALLYEWNDLNAAAEHVQRGLELSQRGGNPEVQFGAYRTMALLKQAQGDATAARAAIEEAHQFARDHHLPPIMGAAIAANYVQIALAQSDIPTAARWAEQVAKDVAFSPIYPSLGLARARLLIAQKQNSAAGAELAKCYEGISRVGWEGGLITIRVLQSLAAETTHARLEFLTEALIRAQPEGFIRVFADAGEVLLPLLQEAARRGTTPEYAGRIIAAIRRSSTPTPAASSPVEPLSGREIEVLRLVAAGLSNRAIAKKLIISLGTAKTHVHNIFGKLDASNRTQAVDRARELGII